MEDQITLNLRGLSQEVRNKIEMLLDKQLNAVPDETNEKALDVLRNFNEQ